MMAKAIGPHSTLRVSGTMARMAAAAVSMIGRKRRTVASRIATQGGSPARMSCSIWSTRITVLRMIMPPRAMVPSMATKPKGWRKTSRASATPMSPKGAVSSTMKVREKLCSWIMRMASTTASIIGMPALIDSCARPDSSSEPPMSMR